MATTLQTVSASCYVHRDYFAAMSWVVVQGISAQLKVLAGNWGYERVPKVLSG